jgi:hypothetical protein
MSEAARAVLAAFDELPSTDRTDVAAAILRRAEADDGLEADLLAAADSLFLSYDAAEAADAGR